ncbi:serine hydrolase [Crateriforma spongiae]|uniref:serine hydrolase n=1 Tax=Crateriforma spongiae TaxID=2724528 RepID=UPI0028F43778|nr:serine hydrolase [Crateriforma spongiae]
MPRIGISVVVPRRFTSAATFLLGMSLLTIPTADAQPSQAKLEAKIGEICRKHDLPAMTVAVVNSKGALQTARWGVRKRGTSDQVQPTDRFAIGSNTKSMTATLAAVLVEAGKIQWNTTIGQVWPKATDQHIHPKLKAVAIDDLLSHQSGLPANISDLSPEAWAGFFAETRAPALERRRMLGIVLSKPPTGDRGQYLYSNLGYAVVAAMLETRAGEPFETLMKKHVFDPLEMTSAEFRSLATAKQMKPPMLWGHKADGSPIDPRIRGAENPTVYASCGTIHIALDDYAKYARWHLAGDPKPVLETQEAFDHLHEPLVESGPGTKYACGWICAPTSLGPGWNHAGSNTNFFALIWVVPESDIATIVCTNSGQSQAFTACDAMTGHLFESHSPDLGKVKPERLVGRYQLNPNFVFDVRYRNGRMMVGITNQPTQEVFADSPTRWSYRSVKATLEFHLRPGKGPAHALTLHQNGAAQKAKRIGN